MAPLFTLRVAGCRPDRHRRHAGDFAELEGMWALYVYPITGRPYEPLPDAWDQITAVRGCTPQACAIRDHHAELRSLNARVYGISTQSSADQREAKRVWIYCSGC